MNESNIERIAGEIGIKPWQVDSVESLINEGASVPFIARYRKEKTGSLDEVVITKVRDRLVQLAELDKRREAILNSLEERELLTEELKEAILSAETLTALEDIYLPYRPKRRTRATIAREKGLEPLALLIMQQDDGTDPEQEAAAFIDKEKGVNSTEEALAGARDIIAEMINEDVGARQTLRQVFYDEGILQSRVVKGKEEEGTKYRDYYEVNELAGRMPGHRILAVFRGEAEGYLQLCIRPEEEKALSLLFRHFIKGRNPCSDQVIMAMEDSYQRLLAPSLETDVRHEIKVRADTEAIRIFGQNLHELLMASPLGSSTVMAIDPGYRTGCKVVCLDPQGKLLYNTTIFPTLSKKLAEEAGKAVMDMVDKFKIEAIAIGNGTAGRETEAFIRGLDLPDSIITIMVNESGASIYSASEVAREEFPDYDITVRGAVSIGRRLMDPLAELVKIDPKSMGVGQYQHDVDQGRLKQSLDDVVISCVNRVGVEVNTASKQILTYVSGIGPALAKNIVEYRNQNGAFKSRQELKKVPRLGQKAFEQAAGFLRIRDSENPLDTSAIHPENYTLVNRMARDIKCSVRELMESEEVRGKIVLDNYIEGDVGIPTLLDILQELKKPGRDPREQFEVFNFTAGINSIDQLKAGMKLKGIVTNITSFGAFVDIGVHQDGLVHISRLAERFVKNPAEVVKIQQKVEVTVVEVDVQRGRIVLSMLKEPQVREEKVPAGED
ncbi:MAG: RNA-binding transcriptional accessory protein [Dehalococcoidales bacterium]|nr:RNA-binding transcriptional accessory protein [Dehalococcoidales bacterium]